MWSCSSARAWSPSDVTKRRRGREQRVGGNIDTLREAHHLLNQLEAVWRQRLDRIGAILADPPEA
jgi:hypothetical protein